MRISDWSSDVCSSDLADRVRMPDIDWIYTRALPAAATGLGRAVDIGWRRLTGGCSALLVLSFAQAAAVFAPGGPASRMSTVGNSVARSEEHTSELTSLMRISYAVFCLKKKIQRAQFTNIVK